MKYAIGFFLLTEVVLCSQLGRVANGKVEKAEASQQLTIRKGQLDTLMLRLDTVEETLRELKRQHNIVISTEPALR